MGYITGLELVEEMLPTGTAVSAPKAQEFIDATIELLNEAYGGVAPESALTRQMVEDRAYYKALGYHFLKGEGARTIPAVVEGLELSDKEFQAYDQRHQTEAEIALESPTAYLREVPW